MYLNIVEFVEDKSRKTKSFVIKPISNEEDVLGFIRWYSPWRKYCFYTCNNTIFDTKCMNEIITFIDKLMEDRKTK